ncbi:MAG: hypothetical protein PUB20_01305 [Clostridia bacterium]|nr:hypothetical protein [Clostridia bacterium]
MKTIKIKRMISLILVLAMLSLCACGKTQEENTDNTNSENLNVRYTEPAGYVSKSETVYVNLDNSGNKVKTVVSDWLHTVKAGVYIDDVTNLSQIENVKDDSYPEIDGQNLRWHMNSTDLYYQGISEAELPLSFEIKYFLNDQEMSAADIVGKSGKVKIQITIHNVDDYTVTVNGQDTVMYNPLVVVGGIVLSESRFQNITVENGKSVGDGSKQYAIFAGFPGISESLGINSDNTNSDAAVSFSDTFTISAETNNFELGNLMFAAVPIGSLDIGLNSIANSMGDVRENLSKLQNIQKSLEAMDANTLLNTLTSDPNKISSLSSVVEEAASLYDNNKALLDVINKYTTPNNIKTMQSLINYIEHADIDGLESTLDILNSVFGDDVSAEAIQAGMNLLREMSKDLSNPDVKKAINNMPKTVETLTALQKAINDNKDLINALKAISETGALNNLSSTLAEVQADLTSDSISQLVGFDGDADEVTAKMSAWIELGKQYTIFTKAPQNATTSVMFVFKVDSVKPGTVSDSSSQSDTKAEESSGLKGLFNKIFKSEKK